MTSRTRTRRLRVREPARRAAGRGCAACGGTRRATAWCSARRPAAAARPRRSAPRHARRRRAGPPAPRRSSRRASARTVCSSVSPKRIGRTSRRRNRAGVDLARDAVDADPGVRLALVDRPDHARGVAVLGQALAVHVEHAEARDREHRGGDEAVAEREPEIAARLAHELDGCVASSATACARAARPPRGRQPRSAARPGRRTSRAGARRFNAPPRPIARTLASLRPPAAQPPGRGAGDVDDAHQLEAPRSRRAPARSARRGRARRCSARAPAAAPSPNLAPLHRHRCRARRSLPRRPRLGRWSIEPRSASRSELGRHQPGTAGSRAPSAKWRTCDSGHCGSK